MVDESSAIPPEMETERGRYASLPFADRRGTRMPGNYVWATMALFYGISEFPDVVRWTLGPWEEKIGDRVIPSAHLCFVYAIDEYDAARKLVGNLEHWDALCATSWFPKYLTIWRREQAAYQKTQLKLSLQLASLGANAVPAARTLIQMIDGSLGKKGRPNKEKPEADEGHVGADAARMGLVAVK